MKTCWKYGLIRAQRWEMPKCNSQNFGTFIVLRRKTGASFLLMRLKPDKETGTHNIPLSGCVIATPVSPDTVTVPAELFQYYEKAVEWTETI